MQLLEQLSSAPDARSPGLDQFRNNPYRLLQLAPSATTQQAIWQGEKMLSRVRAGIVVEADVAPWLSPGTELEIIDAMQTIESPLARLVEQLLWFDFEHDPGGAELRQGLVASDGAALRTYLLKGAEGPLAARLNQVNLRLLIGFSELHGVGPQVLPPRLLDPQTEWTDEDGLSVLPDPHVVLRASRAVAGTWVDLMADAVLAWGRLLRYPDVIEDIRGKLMMLELVDDERVTADDVETLTKALWSRIADLIAAEARLALQSGLVENAARFLELAKRSEIDPAIWLVASKPLRAQLQLELAALDPRPSTGHETLAEVQAHVNRLGVVLSRWKPLDADGMIGLATPIDEAVDAAFGRLRNCDIKERRRTAFADQIARLAELAASSSLRRRIESYHKERAEDLRSAEALVSLTCHFCGEREGTPADAAALVIRLPTTADNPGRAAPVARCAWCAQRHVRIARLSRVMGACYWVALVLYAAVVPASTLGRVLAVVTGAAVVIIAHLLTRGLLARLFTRPGHRRSTQYQDSEAMNALIGAGFWVSTMAYDDRRGVWPRLERGRFDPLDGRPGFVALATVVGQPIALALSGLRAVVASAVPVVLALIAIGMGIALLVAAVNAGAGRASIMIVACTVQVVVWIFKNRD